MLKRARASTPPPASSTPDLLPMLPDEPSARHTMKRRRVLPPSLDGSTRGMNYSHAPILQQPDDDGEEYMDNEDDERDRVRIPVPQTYKAVNSLLHDLHAEHQHRLLWSSPSPSTPYAPVPTYSYPASAAAVAQHHIAQTARAHLPQATPPYSVSMRSKQVADGQLLTPPPSTSHEEGTAMQYEDTNRLLREAFLSRRRQLSGS
ncbi:unnamed protein product [Peniophora sp. CBMAI 1063]|nr:unnamed protein product [Peniophora sp. CBMAI 1063]